MVDKVALGQFLPEYFGFPVNLIPPVLRYMEIRKKLIFFIIGLHNKPQGCGASVASAAGPFTTITKLLIQISHDDSYPHIVQNSIRFRNM
jgi:hypothetical protein